MKIGIIGSGFIGTSLAKKLLKAGHEVVLSNSRGPESLIPLIEKLGQGASAASSKKAASNEVVILAVRWKDVEGVLKTVKTSFDGNILLDATNPILGTSELLDLGDTSSSEIVASLVPNALVIKAFNALIGQWIDADPVAGGGHRVVFLSGDDQIAKKTVAQLIEAMQFAPIDIGSLKIGGALQQAGKPLAAQNLIKLN
jgi:predicted dinucleotide-binding enzyme